MSDNPTDSKSYAHLYNKDGDIDMKALIDEKFRAGEGVLMLQPDMPDSIMLDVVKNSVRAADGKSFLVITSPAHSPSES